MLEPIFRTMFYRALNKRSRRHRSRYPSLFCIPSDDLGELIVIDGIYEQEIIEYLISDIFPQARTALADSVCLDIGAHIGNHSLMFARHFGRVLSFEPNPVIQNVLRANIMVNGAENIDLQPYALGDANRSMSLIINRKEGFTSFIDTGTPAHKRAKERTQVEVRKGDEAVAEAAGDAPVAFVKMDVDGFEPEVIQGLAERFGQDKPLIAFEYIGPGEGGAIIRELNALGYRDYYGLGFKSMFGPNPSKLLGRVSKIVQNRRIAATPLDADNLPKRFYHLVLAVHPDSAAFPAIAPQE